MSFGIDHSLLEELSDPKDYFKGVGKGQLPTPENILVFFRPSRHLLQQEALQNRSHHRFVLLVNLETSGQVHVDQLSLRFEPGQAMVIHPYQFHHFSQLASSQLKWVVCTFELETEVFLGSLRNRRIFIQDESVRMLQELLKVWQRTEQGDASPLLQVTLLALLICLKHEGTVTGGSPSAEPTDNLLREVNHLMMTTRGKLLQCRDVSIALGYSESYVRKRFLEAAGIPLGRYLQNFRINRAMALLHRSELSIADVAEEAGFGSPQAFSRGFKQETGQSPRSYRAERGYARY